MQKKALFFIDFSLFIGFSLFLSILMIINSVFEWDSKIVYQLQEYIFFTFYVYNFIKCVFGIALFIKSLVIKEVNNHHQRWWLECGL